MILIAHNCPSNTATERIRSSAHTKRIFFSSEPDTEYRHPIIQLICLHVGSECKHVVMQLLFLFCLFRSPVFPTHFRFQNAQNFIHCSVSFSGKHSPCCLSIQHYSTAPIFLAFACYFLRSPLSSVTEDFQSLFLLSAYFTTSPVSDNVCQAFVPRLCFAIVRN